MKIDAPFNTSLKNVCVNFDFSTLFLFYRSPYGANRQTDGRTKEQTDMTRNAAYYKAAA